MQNLKKTLMLLMALGILTLACNMPGGQAIRDSDIQNTFVAETVAAEIAEADQTETKTSVPQSTATPQPTSTEQPTANLQPTNTPQPTATSIPCNKASFVSDVTYPDGSDLTIGESFVKTWRLQNNGSCDWTAGYKLVFSNGDRMNAPDEVALTSGTVAPGQTMDVSVNLTAPDTEGTWKGYFKLKAPDGQVFGIGTSGNSPFYVEVETFLPALPPAAVAELNANVSYREQLTCSSGGSNYYRLIFRVENTGDLDIQSYRTIIDDHSISQTYTLQVNYFGTVSSCSTSTVAEIPSTHSAFVASDRYNAQLIGNSVTARITLCSEDNLGGECIEKTLNFVE